MTIEINQEHEKATLKVVAEINECVKLCYDKEISETVAVEFLCEIMEAYDWDQVKEAIKIYRQDYTADHKKAFREYAKSVTNKAKETVRVKRKKGKRLAQSMFDYITMKDKPIEDYEKSDSHPWGEGKDRRNAEMNLRPMMVADWVEFKFKQLFGF